MFSVDGVSFLVNHELGVVPAKFAPGDWTLAGNIVQEGKQFTFSGLNPADEFGTFSVSCTPPPPTPMQAASEEVGEGWSLLIYMSHHVHINLI